MHMQGSSSGAAHTGTEGNREKQNEKQRRSQEGACLMCAANALSPSSSLSLAALPSGAGDQVLLLLCSLRSSSSRAIPRHSQRTREFCAATLLLLPLHTQK